MSHNYNTDPLLWRNYRISHPNAKALVRNGHILVVPSPGEAGQWLARLDNDDACHELLADAGWQSLGTDYFAFNPSPERPGKEMRL